MKKPALPFSFKRQLAKLETAHQKLLARRNIVDATWYNGLFDRFQYPVLTAEHAPLFWRLTSIPKPTPI
jgi:4-O-beta-D-mannosyl-D-glucose phosphorylase